MLPNPLLQCFSESERVLFLCIRHLHQLCRYQPRRSGWVRLRKFRWCLQVLSVQRRFVRYPKGLVHHFAYRFRLFRLFRLRQCKQHRPLRSEVRSSVRELPIAEIRCLFLLRRSIKEGRLRVRREFQFCPRHRLQSQVYQRFLFLRPKADFHLKRSFFEYLIRRVRFWNSEFLLVLFRV